MFNAPTAFSSIMVWALVLAADMVSGDGEEKNWRMKFMEGRFELVRSGRGGGRGSRSIWRGICMMRMWCIRRRAAGVAGGGRGCREGK